MALSFSTRIAESVPIAAGQYFRLVLAVGPARSGKTQALIELAEARGWSRINANLQLSELLLDLNKKQRAVRIAGLLDDIVKAKPSDVVLLDNIEMLFAVELAQDPFRLLQGLSRNRTVVASWPGSFDGHVLTYAEPGHREFKKYVAPQAVIVVVADANPTDVSVAQEDKR
jgi:hypothetical protein